MILDKIINVPEARIIFAKRDVDVLEESAKRHYDHRCKTEVLGIVRMLRNQLSHSATAEMCFDQTQVQFMGKACEQGNGEAVALLPQFATICSLMNHSFEFNNPE